MKKNLLQKCRIISAGVVTGCAMIAMFTSCDEQYDLSQEIDTNISLGGDHFTLPLGSTKKLELSEIFDLEDSGIEVVNGKYQYSYAIDKDDIGSTSFTTPQITFNAIDCAIPSTELGIELPSIPAGFEDYLDRVEINENLSAKTDEGFETEFNFSEEIDQRVIELSKVAFEGENGIELKIKFSGLAPAISKIWVDEFSITLPQFLLLDTSSSLPQTNEVVVEPQEIAVVNGAAAIVVPIAIEGIQNSEPINNGTITLSDKIAITPVGVTLATEGLKYSDLINYTMISIEPSASLATLNSGSSTITVREITGAIDPGSDGEISETTSIELPEFLSEDGNKLALKNTAVKLELGSNAPFDLSSNMSIKAISSHQDASTGNMNIAIAKSSSTSMVQESNYWICDNSNTIPAGFNYIASDISSLINIMPNTIAVDMKVEPISGIFALGETYNITPELELIAPIEFAKGMRFSYEEVADIDLSEIAKNSKAMQLNLTTINTIPLEIGLSIECLDDDDRVVEGVRVQNDAVIASGVVGSDAVKSDQVIAIEATEVGALAKVTKFSFKFYLESTNADGGYLEESQYLQIIKMSAKLPGGITADLDL